MRGFLLRNPVLKEIVKDRALQSDSGPYKLAMRILFFMSYVAQLEAKIPTLIFLKKYILKKKLRKNEKKINNFCLHN